MLPKRSEDILDSWAAISATFKCRLQLLAGDFAGINGRFRNIMASLAEFKGRVMIYERLSKGKRRKASEGGYIGGRSASSKRNCSLT